MINMTDKTIEGQNGKKTVTEKIRDVKEKKDVLEKAKKAAAGLLEDKEDILEKPKEAVKEQYRKAAKAAVSMKTSTEGPVPAKDPAKEAPKGPETSSLKDEIEAIIAMADEDERAEYEERISAMVNSLRKEIVSGCKAEMVKEREKDVTKIRWIVTAGVFFACLTLYTTVMSLNSLGWLNNLDSSVRNMQSLMLQENNAVYNRIREFDKKLGTDKIIVETKDCGIPDKIPGIPIFGRKLAGVRALPVIAELPMAVQQTEALNRARAAERQALEQAAAEQAAEQQNIAARQMMAEKDRVAGETAAAENAAEQAVVNQAKQIAGITYDMYIGAPQGDRLNILSTHFNTNIVLMEYMLKTMAVNSGVKGQFRTQEQIEANLQAILQTEAGRKMQAAYAVWETLKDDYQSLAEIDRRIIENRFYGLPFIAAVEKAIIQE